MLGAMTSHIEKAYYESKMCSEFSTKFIYLLNNPYVEEIVKNSA